LVENHLVDSDWREVFLLVAGLLDEADEFLQQLENEIQKYIRNTPNLQKLLHWITKLTVE